MDWSKGYSASFYAKRVDPATWRDLETINVISGSISRERTGLRESADLECTNYRRGTESWIRVYMDAHQSDGSSAHEALFTGLATSPDNEFNGRIRKDTLECYSVLKPAEDMYLQRGWYAPAGMRGGDVIGKLLSVIPAPVTVADESPRLTESIIAEDKETRLSMTDKVLKAIDWRIRIDGAGNVSVEPNPMEDSALFDPLESDMIEKEIKISADWYSCPNVFMAISEEMTGIARDDNIDNILSTVNRGREVWAIETGCDLADNESIAAYAKRRLREEQQIQKTAEYDRRYMPDVLPGDLIQIRYPEQCLDGSYQVESQTVELGYGARTSEKISMTITRDDLVGATRRTIFVSIIDDQRAKIITDEGERISALTEVEE